MKRFLPAACLLALALPACGDMPDWLTGEEKKKPLPGERIAVLEEGSKLKADPALTAPVAVPQPQANADWAGLGGAVTGMTGNLQWSGNAHHDSVRIGDGNGWEQPLYTNIAVSGGRVFALDAKGYVTAHNAARIGEQLWSNKSLVETDEPDLLGGGVAVEAGLVVVTSGYGKVAALDVMNGKELWKQAIGIPLREAPRVAGGIVYVVSVDNQLFALDAASGRQRWSHRGISETAGFMTALAPTVSDNIAIVPYSSGELHALDVASGQGIWSDTLVLARRTTATAGFSGIGGTPVIANETVYAGDGGGFFAAISLISGRRIWEQDVSSLNMPWVAGDYLFLLSEGSKMICLNRADGRVKWIQQLPRFENEEKRKGPYVWRGPVMANGKLMVVGRHGQMLALAPDDGRLLETLDIPDGVMDAPVLAGGKLYLLTQDAELYSYY